MRMLCHVSAWGILEDPRVVGQQDTRNSAASDSRNGGKGRAALRFCCLFVGDGLGPERRESLPTVYRESWVWVPQVRFPVPVWSRDERKRQIKFYSPIYPSLFCPPAPS